jgi:hypothetical protein
MGGNNFGAKDWEEMAGIGDAVEATTPKAEVEIGAPATNVTEEIVNPVDTEEQSPCEGCPCHCYDEVHDQEEK